MKNKGQALTEYLLIIVVISFIVIQLVTMFGGYLQDKLTEFSCGIMETTYQKGEKPGEGKCVVETDQR